MNRSAYYDEMKALAREVRVAHGITTPKVTLTIMRQIYKTYGIKIKLWPHRLKKLKGAYFNDETGPHVMIDGNLPAEQRIFTMAHELKHHLADRPDCQSHDPEHEKEPVEIAAEIFAAELIFPDQDFAVCLASMGIREGCCTAETIVRLKRVSETTMSYAGMAKKAEFLGFASQGSLTATGVKWIKLRDMIYGEPTYKQMNRIRGKTA